MEQENIPNKIKRHAIGRPAIIGSLYNATKDILYDEQLYVVSENELIEEVSGKNLDDILIPFELSDLNANPMKRLFDVDNDTHVSMLCELNEPFSTFYESFMSKGLLLNTTNQQWKSIDAGLVFNFTTKNEQFMNISDIGVYEEFHEKAILKCSEATHVIVGIQYGVTLIVKASCNLQIMDEPEEGRRAIKTCLAILKSENVTTEDRLHLENILTYTKPSRLNLELFADKICIKCSPTTIDDLNNFNEEIQKIIMNLKQQNSWPQILFLQPISLFKHLLQSAITPSYIEPEVGITKNLIDVLLTLKQRKADLQDLKNLFKFFDFCIPLNVINQVADYNNQYEQSFVKMTKQIGEFVVSVRSGGTKEFTIDHKKVCDDVDSFLLKYENFNNKLTFVRQFFKSSYGKKQRLYFHEQGPHEQLNNLNDYYIFFFKWSLQTVELQAHLRLFIRYMYEIKEACVVADLDMCPVLLNNLNGIKENSLCHHYYGQTNFEVLDKDRKIKEKCFAKPLTPCENFEERPEAIAQVYIPCPRNDCVKDKRYWYCYWCLCLLEYGYDSYFYCNCGRAKASSYVFCCTYPIHRNYKQFEDELELNAHLDRLNPIQETTILILGETGVGKSTFINALTNYLQQVNLIESDQPIIPQIQIPVSFTIMDENYQEKLVEINCANEDKRNVGESCTQDIRTYSLKNASHCFRFIDTPGFGDTRGLEQDKCNAEMISDYIQNLTEIHGICFILKPDISRLTQSFQYVLSELIRQLDKRAARNINFCFTYCRNTFYRPGSTYKLLESYINEINSQKDWEIPISQKNVFCFDNEGFRYACAKYKDIELDEDELISYSKSWKNAVNETERFLKYFKEIDPYEVQKDITEAKARNIAINLCNPLIDTLENLVENLVLAREDFELLKRSKSRSSIDLRNMILKWFPIKLIKPNKVILKNLLCTNDFEILQIDPRTDLLHAGRRICHTCANCKSKFVRVPKDRNIQECLVFQLNTFFKCSVCGCNWKKHIISNHIVSKALKKQKIPFEEISEELDLQLDKKIQLLKEEIEKILKTCVKLGIFLKPKGYKGDMFNQTLKPIARTAKHIARKHINNESMIQKSSQLDMLLVKYKEDREQYLKYYESKPHELIRLEDISKYQDQMFALKHSGTLIKSLSDFNEKIEREFAYEKEVTTNLTIWDKILNHF